jgi:gluconate 2-dehydrogenase alpha chain
LPVLRRCLARALHTYCGFCERFGCEVGAKADPTVTVIPLALKTGHFELRMRANAFQITNDGKTAKSVLYYDAHGAVQEQPADIVIVASYVFNNARLLLMSKLGTPYDRSAARVWSARTTPTRRVAQHGARRPQRRQHR